MPHLATCLQQGPRPPHPLLSLGHQYLRCHHLNQTRYRRHYLPQFRNPRPADSSIGEHLASRKDGDGTGGANGDGTTQRSLNRDRDRAGSGVAEQSRMGETARDGREHHVHPDADQKFLGAGSHAEYDSCPRNQHVRLGRSGHRVEQAVREGIRKQSPVGPTRSTAAFSVASWPHGSIQFNGLLPT